MFFLPKNNTWIKIETNQHWTTTFIMHLWFSAGLELNYTAEIIFGHGKWLKSKIDQFENVYDIYLNALNRAESLVPYEPKSFLTTVRTMSPTNSDHNIFL